MGLLSAEALAGRSQLVAQEKHDERLEQAQASAERF